MTPGDLIRETLQKQLTINQVNRLVRQLFVLQGDEGGEVQQRISD